METFDFWENALEKLKSFGQRIKALEYKLGLIADYTVEVGQTGIWTYVKKASGIYEAWGNTSVSVAMTNAIQNTYYGNNAVYISDLGFTEIKAANVTGQASGAYFGTKIEFYNTNQLHLSSRASASNTSTINFSINIKGLWKTFVGGVLSNIMALLPGKAVIA